MTVEPTVEPTVVDIDIARDRAVTLTYDDGVVIEVPVARLRAACPCASCRGWRERGEEAWPRPGLAPTVSVVDASLVGAWGLSIRWSDGHDTGIYAWSVLRRWWAAGLDTALTPEPGESQAQAAAGADAIG